MAKKKEYLVVNGVQSDKKGTRFEPGEFVTEDDFPKRVINYWLVSGTLKDPTEKKKKGGAK